MSSILLYPHQQNGCRKMQQVYSQGSKGFFENSPMGAGKSREVLAFYDTIVKPRSMLEEQCAMLLIAPLAVVAHWEHEILVTKLAYPVIVYQGPKRDQLKLPRRRAFIVLTTLETLRADLKKNRHLIFEFPFHFLVVDEAHNFTNMDDIETNNGLVSGLCRIRSGRSSDIPLYQMVFHKLQRYFTIVLTGTPLKNDESDIASLFALTRIPLPMSIRNNLVAMGELYQQFAYRAPSEEILKNLPPVEHRVIKLKYTTTQIDQEAHELYGIYAEVKAKVQSFLSRGLPVPPPLHKKYNAVRTHARLYDTLHCKLIKHVPSFDAHKNNAKFVHVAEFILEHPDLKIVVASEFSTALREFGKFMTMKNVQWTIYDGSCNKDKRQKALHAYLTGDINVLLLSKKAGGCGLNLFGHVMFLLEPYINHALDDQVKSRIVRLGQTHTVMIYHLLFPCMDTEMWNVKQQKLAKATFFVDDEKESLHSVYECTPNRIQELREKVSTKEKGEEKKKKKKVVARKSKRKASEINEPEEPKVSKRPKAKKLKPSCKVMKTSEVKTSKVKTSEVKMETSAVKTKKLTKAHKSTNSQKARDSPLLLSKSPTFSLPIPRSSLSVSSSSSSSFVCSLLPPKQANQRNDMPQTQVLKKMPQSRLWLCQNKKCNHMNIKRNLPNEICGLCSLPKGAKPELSICLKIKH